MSGRTQTWEYDKHSFPLLPRGPSRDEGKTGEALAVACETHTLPDA